MSSFFKDYCPKLFSILSELDKSDQKMPLLIEGASEEEWNFLLGEVTASILKEDVKTEDVRKRNIYPDIIILEREEGKQTIGIEEVREFAKELSISTSILPFKLGIIPASQYLGIPSQNALLKTLEEPLKNRFLILGVKNTNQLLPTILSRCMFFSLPQKKDIVESFLEKNFPDLTTAQRSNITNWSGGKLSKAKKIAENIAYWEEINSFWENCQKASPSWKMKEAEKWSTDYVNKVDDILEFLTARIHSDLLKALKENDRDEARELTDKLKKVFTVSQKIGKPASANKRMLLEALLINI